MSDSSKPSANSVSTPASVGEISLSQAILAPLDALFQAQVHGARSFLNLLLQIGYPHIELNEKGQPDDESKKKKQVYTQDFIFNDAEGKQIKVSIPSLALVPITPLSIENASFKLDFKVEKHDKYQQIQASEKDVVNREKDGNTGWSETNRPWYLVKDPVSFKGNVAPSSDQRTTSNSSSSVINIEINLTRQPLPSGLDKLLTALQQSSSIEPVNP